MKTKLKSFKELTKKFTYVNSDIESNFPLEAPRSEEYKLYHFDSYITSEEAIAEMQKDGYEAATLSELLSWKDWNESDTVIALGSVAGILGRRSVPGLWEDRSGRYLDLRWFDDGWYGHYRFLAVRQVSKTQNSEKSSETLGKLDPSAVELDHEARIAALEERMGSVLKALRNV